MFGLVTVQSEYKVFLEHFKLPNKRENKLGNNSVFNCKEKNKLSVLQNCN